MDGLECSFATAVSYGVLVVGGFSCFPFVDTEVERKSQLNKVRQMSYDDIGMMNEEGKETVFLGSVHIIIVHDKGCFRDLIGPSKRSLIKGCLLYWLKLQIIP